VTWRLLQIFIVMLWLTATVMLVRRTYFPDENRYPPASPKLISDLYFGNAESTDLVLIKEGQPFGRISMTLPRLTASRELIPVRPASFMGHMEADLESGVRGLQWTGSIVFDDRLNLRSFRFSPTSLELRGDVELSFEPPRLHYKLAMNDEVVLDSRNEALNQENLALMEPLAKSSGLSLGWLGDPNSKETLATIASLRPTVSARHGQFQINSNRYEGYVVTYTFLEEAKLRLYFSDQGELLKADGIPNVTLLAETFVTRGVPPPPRRAYKR